MARPLLFKLGEDEVSLEMHKVDRARLYGSKEQSAVDESDAACELATLADDGRTLIGKGGTAMGWIDASGKWCDKSDLTPINLDGETVEPVKSSFGQVIELFETVEVDEYLDHNIRLLYSMRPEESSDADSNESNKSALTQLQDAVCKGSIFAFDYSFRGGLQADAAFLLANDSGELMMAVGTRSKVNMIGLASQSVSDELAETTPADASFDFDMI